MSVRNVMFSAFGVFGVLETVFVAFALTDASLCIIKTYPTFVLISFATILSLLIVFIAISIWLFGLFRKTPGPACEVIECLDEQVGMHHKKETERLRHVLSGEGESLPPQLSDEEKACQALKEFSARIQRDRERKEELEILRMKQELANPHPESYVPPSKGNEI